MTKSTTVASKAFVAVVAAAMVFSLVAPAAKAATAEELQAQIAALMAQITALQGGSTTTTTTTTSTSGAYTFTRALTIGSTGADVTALQNYLISKGHAIAAGATGYFGAQTAAAVAAWQTANGITPAAGYFGPVSQAKYMAMMASTPTTPTTPGTDDEDDTDSTDLQGEASLDKFEVDDADDTTVEEGDEEVELGMFTAKFTDGDAEISRLDLALTNSDVDAHAWDAFDSVQLMVDGKVVAEADASSKDDYLGDEDDGIIRFSGLKLVAMEDEDMEITVSATIQDNLDTEELSEWELNAQSLRFFDADGVATTEEGASTNEVIDTDEVATFTIEMAGENEELKFSLGSGNPDSTDIVVDENSATNGVTVLEYTIEATDGDIDLTTLGVMLTTTDIINDVVADIEIEVDGQTFSDDSFIGSKANATTTYLFDIDGDVTIDDGDEVTVKVMVDFKSQDPNGDTVGNNYNNGTTIKAEAIRNETEAEGADELDTTQFKGTAVGDTHNLVATGIIVPVDGFTAVTPSKVDADGKVYQFQLDFEVTAVESDFYITDNATSTSNNPADGIGFTVDGGAAAVTAVLDSTGDEENPGVFTVRDGETETFTLTVTVDPTAAGTFRVTLDEVWYSEDVDGITAADDFIPTPASDFRSKQQSIAN